MKKVTVRILGGALALAVAWGCGGVTQSAQESRAWNIPGEKFERLAVIAGGDGNFELQVATRARSLLEEKGWEAEAPSGRWSTESAAVQDLCSRGVDEGDREYDGVIFVLWDQLTLKDCESEAEAFNVDGGFEGVDGMVERLVRYLRGLPPTESE